MQIADFLVEIWMNRYEDECQYNLAETCVQSLTVAQLLDLAGQRDAVLAELAATPLTYGPIRGSDRLRGLIAGLYDTHSPEDVMVTHGTIGANMLVYKALVEPGDHVVSVVPTYQQHTSIPASLGADVDLLALDEAQGWRLDLDRLRELAHPGTKLIALANPNNPTGALLSRADLEQVVAIADAAGAWLLADEVYRGIDQAGTGSTTSAADLYPKAISTGGMSKPYSLAGLRLGWITGPAELIEAVSVHRDYDTISVSRVDDLLASVALAAKDVVLARSRDITQRNLAILDGWVASRPDVMYVRPAGGTTALLRYSPPLGSYDFCTRLLEDTGVMFTPGAAFGIEGTVRIGFADDTDNLKVGLDLVGEFLDSLEH
ncbi:MAG: aminotransferase class I/II-fold pyridoxal phosphate-dependent enzyme [Bifidobacteriaceae bacterium]|nr:aminotransferase class I/II-fold pyridoxal phosphate-dependent enzyme [Bifidobacteriaceae bacterium]